MRHWWSWVKGSLTVKGAIVTGIGIICDPNVAALLPAKAARVVAVVGGVATAIGLRRALPAPLSIGTPVFNPLPATDERGLSAAEAEQMRALGDAVFPKKSGIGTGGGTP